MGLLNLDHMITYHATIFVYILERKDLRRIHSLLVINMVCVSSMTEPRSYLIR